MSIDGTVHLASVSPKANLAQNVSRMLDISNGSINVEALALVSLLIFLASVASILLVNSFVDI